MRRLPVKKSCWRLIACCLCLAGAVGCERSSTGVVGKPAPDFEFSPIGGKPQRLSDLKGKPVIVNFFATWCGPCMIELPELDKKVASAFADRGLVVVAIGIDQKSEDVEEFEKSAKHSFLIAADPKTEIYAKFQNMTGEDAIPQTFLIKPDGTIEMHLVGYNPSVIDDLKTKAEKLLPAKP